MIGGGGLIGSKLVHLLRQDGHDVLPASPNSGVNTLTGEGLADALKGAEVVVDVSNSPSLDGKAAMDFFVTSNRNLLAAEGGREAPSSRFRSSARNASPTAAISQAKAVQENMIKDSSIPYSIPGIDPVLRVHRADREVGPGAAMSHRLSPATTIGSRSSRPRVPAVSFPEHTARTAALNDTVEERRLLRLSLSTKLGPAAAARSVPAWNLREPCRTAMRLLLRAELSEQQCR